MNNATRRLSQLAYRKRDRHELPASIQLQWSMTRSKRMGYLVRTANTLRPLEAVEGDT
jgi:hypothetical protein